MNAEYKGYDPDLDNRIPPKQPKEYTNDNLPKSAYVFSVIGFIFGMYTLFEFIVHQDFKVLAFVITWISYVIFYIIKRIK